jgi:hypothetical protein
MQPNLDDVRAWMEDGDRLLAQSWDYLAASDADPAQLEFAGEGFARATRSYLSGAIEYQHGPTTVADAETNETSARLVMRLDGRLRAEAEAAQSASVRRHVASRDSRRVSVERAQMLAEELRERFAHAAPELFTRPIDTAFERVDAPVRSR